MAGVASARIANRHALHSLFTTARRKKQRCRLTKRVHDVRTTRCNAITRSKCELFARTRNTRCQLLHAPLKLKKLRWNKGFCCSDNSLRVRLDGKFFARRAFHFALTLFAANASAR